MFITFWRSGSWQLSAGALRCTSAIINHSWENIKISPFKIWKMFLKAMRLEIRNPPLPSLSFFWIFREIFFHSLFTHLNHEDKNLESLAISGFRKHTSPDEAISDMWDLVVLMSWVGRLVERLNTCVGVPLFALHGCYAGINGAVHGNLGASLCLHVQAHQMQTHLGGAASSQLPLCPCTATFRTWVQHIFLKHMQTLVL